MGGGALLLAGALAVFVLVLFFLHWGKAGETLFGGGRYKGRERPRVFTYLSDYSAGGEERERQSQLYRLLGEVGRGLEARKIPYWGMGGTTLGAVRHGALIPWDDDIDIGVWEADLARVEKMVEGDLGGLLGWSPARRSYVVTLRDSPATFMDIFPMRLEPNGRINFANPEARDKWPKEFLTPSEFGAGPEPRPFGPIFVPVIERPCPYLDRVYPGWDWSGRIVRHYQLADGTSRADERTIVRFNPQESRSSCGDPLSLPGEHSEALRAEAAQAAEGGGGGRGPPGAGLRGPPTRKGPGAGSGR